MDPRFLLDSRSHEAPAPLSSPLHSTNSPRSVHRKYQTNKWKTTTHVVDPRSMNLMATSPSSWRSQASWTMPDVPSKRSQISS